MASESITSGWVGGEEPGGGQGSPQRSSDWWEPRPGLHSVLVPLPSTPALGESEPLSPSAALPPSSCGKNQGHLDCCSDFSIPIFPWSTRLCVQGLGSVFPPGNHVPCNRLYPFTAFPPSHFFPDAPQGRRERSPPMQGRRKERTGAALW